jgi:anti-anti-sigma factor
MTRDEIMPRIEDFPEPLRTRLERHGDTIVVIASGEIDVSSAGRLEAQLRGLLDSCRRLVLDLQEVVFIESSGLHCILAIDRASGAAGTEFALVPGPPQVHRLFAVTRTDTILEFVEQIERGHAGD